MVGVRWGSVLTGSYRFSARRLLHSSYPGCGTRVLLVAWVPSSWERCPVPLMRAILNLGFVAPTHSQAQRAKESIWGPRTCWQPPIFTVTTQWGRGQLKPAPPEAIDLEDSEDDVVIRSLTDGM